MRELRKLRGMYPLLPRTTGIKRRARVMKEASVGLTASTLASKPSPQKNIDIIDFHQPLILMALTN